MHPIRVPLDEGMTMDLEFIDADAHVVEAELVGECLKRWPGSFTLRESGGFPEVLTEGRRYPDPTGPGAGCPPEHGLKKVEGINPYSPEGMLADADRDGIGQMVFFPSFGLRAPSIESPELAVGFCELYNEWISDWCRRGKGRFHGVAVVPAEHVERAIPVLRKAKDRGLVCAMIPPALKKRNLDHPDLDPLYAAAVDLDLPLGVHGAPGIHLPKIGVDRFDNYIQVHCVSFPFDQMTAMTALVSGGVFDRHPALRVAFLEAGVGWVPYFIDRMHEHYEKRGDWIRNGWKRDPQEYVATGNIWVSCEPEEPILPAVVQILGADFIMYASDYPHWDAAWPQSTKPLREREDLDDGARIKVAGGNARRFYKLSS
jgi:predicted TIM-barrel fold metal-dependent hydrolase